MAEKRRNKRKKEEEFVTEEKISDKPSRDEIAVAKWMKKNVQIKRTKFAGHNVEYFTGSKAVDVLLNSEWSLKNEKKDPLFNSRQDIIVFLNSMLRNKLFHRAKKIPVSEHELRAKLKKRDRRDEESNNGERRVDSDSKISEEKRFRKIKLEMHFDQTFVDNFDAYVWIYDPIPLYYWAIGALVVLGAIAVCLFPLWPPTVRLGVQYISMAAASVLILILVLAILRLVVFAVVWSLSFGKLYVWLLPNLTEDVGFFASFWPLYEYKYGTEDTTEVKNSDNEEESKTKLLKSNDNKKGVEQTTDVEEPKDAENFEGPEKKVHTYFPQGDDDIIDLDDDDDDDNDYGNGYDNYGGAYDDGDGDGNDNEDGDDDDDDDDEVDSDYDDEEEEDEDEDEDDDSESESDDGSDTDGKLELNQNQNVENDNVGGSADTSNAGDEPATTPNTPGKNSVGPPPQVSASGNETSSLTATMQNACQVVKDVGSGNTEAKQ